MFRYIIKRTVYSIFVILGVVLVTFALFRLAAGDPAETVLGKNPSPKEVEDLRDSLGVNKPMFIGGWNKTEAFSNCDFRDFRDIPGVELNGQTRETDEGVALVSGKIELKRHFELAETPLSLKLTWQGKIDLNGKTYESATLNSAWIPLDHKQDTIIIDNPEQAIVRKVEFFKGGGSVFDNQFCDALTEIVSLKSSFPFVSIFNFGRTLITREKISDILWRGVWPSLFLMIPIFFLEIVVGIFLALLSTAANGRWPDRVIMAVSIAGMSISYLVFIIFGQWYLGYYFNVFPVWGYGDVRHLILPIFIGVLSGLGGNARFYRTIFVNELNREYLRTALAKGVSNFKIYFVHLLRNASIPIIARATTTIPFLFTGSLLLESFFGIPGLGYVGVNALMNSDLQLVKALVIISALLFVIVNLLADITYAWADPRIRLK